MKKEANKKAFHDKARAWLKRHSVIRLLVFWLLVLTLPIHLMVTAMLSGLQEIWADRRILWRELKNAKAELWAYLKNVHAEIWADLHMDWKQWKERSHE